MSREKHFPTQLYRFVLIDKLVVYDQKQVLPGRGAYLLPESLVLEKARQLKFWQRAFRLKDGSEVKYAELSKLLKRLQQEIIQGEVEEE